MAVQGTMFPYREGQVMVEVLANDLYNSYIDPKTFIDISKPIADEVYNQLANKIQLDKFVVITVTLEMETKR